MDLFSPLPYLRNLLLRDPREAHIPVVVYQMGKVGSTSIYQSLKRIGVFPVFHVHRMNRRYIEDVWRDLLRNRHEPPYKMDREGLYLYEAVVRARRRGKFITLVRDPVSRNVSAFFQNIVGKRGLTPKHDASELVEVFLKEYPHDVPLQWFQREPLQTLGIDVLASSFPRDKGYTVLRYDPWELLVLRTELPDGLKRRVIEEFIGINNLRIRRANVGGQKEYAEAYRNFKSRVKLPRDYLNRMCESRYAKHFYTEDEISEIIDQWS